MTRGVPLSFAQSYYKNQDATSGNGARGQGPEKDDEDPPACECLNDSLPARIHMPISEFPLRGPMIAMAKTR